VLLASRLSLVYFLPFEPPEKAQPLKRRDSTWSHNSLASQLHQEYSMRKRKPGQEPPAGRSADASFQASYCNVGPRSVVRRWSKNENIMHNLVLCYTPLLLAVRPTRCVQRCLVPRTHHKPCGPLFLKQEHPGRAHDLHLILSLQGSNMNLPWEEK